jgi:hypothetical protein
MSYEHMIWEIRNMSEDTESPFKRLVMRVWWWRPWNIVIWIYIKKGPKGPDEHAVLVKKGTTYLWRIMVAASVVWLCNVGLRLVGFDNHQATLLIYDA